MKNITDGLNLDRSNWELVKFGDVAIQQKESVNRDNTELTRYVKGEHMYSEDIHLREWGELTDEYLGPAFIRKFEEGDILYGSRRTYLRKVTIAPFDGITSNTTFVIKANEKKIDAQLLPFVMLSEGFAQHSIRNSKGSVNPYVNWKDLADYEFLLPPKEQQVELAELLWAMDESMEKDLAVLERLEVTRELSFQSIVSMSEGIEKPFSEVLIPKKGKSAIPHKRDKYIGLEHVDSGVFDCVRYGDASEAESSCNIVDVGDLCYSKLRPYLDKAFIASFDAISTTEILVYDTKEISKEYALYHLHSKPFIAYVSGKGFGTKMPRVSNEIVGQYVIKVIKDESILLSKMKAIRESESGVKSKIAASKALQKSLINEVF